MNTVTMQASYPHIQHPETALPDLLGRFTPIPNEKKIGLYSVIHQTMRALSPSKLIYQAMQIVCPQQLEKMIIKKAENLAQDFKKNMLELYSKKMCPLNIYFEEGIACFSAETVEEKTAEIIQKLKVRHPIKEKAELFSRQAIAYQLDPVSMLYDIKSEIKNESKQYKNIDFKKHEKELCEKYIDQHYIGKQHKEEMTQFIIQLLNEKFSDAVAVSSNYPPSTSSTSGNSSIYSQSDWNYSELNYTNSSSSIYTQSDWDFNELNYTNPDVSSISSNSSISTHQSDWNYSELNYTNSSSSIYTQDH